LSRVLLYLARFAAIVFGYAAAALACSLFIHLLVYPQLAFEDPALQAGAGYGMIVTVPFVALLAGYYGFLPAIPIILVGEALARRDWLFYALAGAAVALMALALARAAQDMSLLGDDAGAAMALLGAGMAAGIVYWAAAGRRAGSWLPRERERLSGPERSES
jgi:fucose 4-O-acetylase-like acetyltransferase